MHRQIAGTANVRWVELTKLSQHEMFWKKAKFEAPLRKPFFLDMTSYVLWNRYKHFGGLLRLRPQKREYFQDGVSKQGRTVDTEAPNVHSISDFCSVPSEDLVFGTDRMHWEFPLNLPELRNIEWRLCPVTATGRWPLSWSSYHETVGGRRRKNRKTEFFYRKYCLLSCKTLKSAKKITNFQSSPKCRNVGVNIHEASGS